MRPEDGGGLPRLVAATMEKYRMLPPAGAPLVAGVSGGADSAALLDILCLLAPRYGFSLHAVHVHHGIRGKEADRDADAVRELCAARGVPLTVFYEDVPAYAAAGGLSLEEAGRRRRYACFSALAGRLGEGARVATAHTRADSVETVIFNLCRGTGIEGLCGIPPVRGRVVRPLIEAGREEVEDYCRRRGIAYVTDSTNFSDDYSRNRIRHRVVPELERVHPGAQRAIAGMAEALRGQAALLQGLARQTAQSLRRGDGYDARSLAGAPPALRGLVVAQLLKENGAQVSRARVQRIDAALSRPKYAEDLGASRTLRIEGGLLSFSRRRARGEAPAAPADCVPIGPGSIVQFQGRRVEVLCDECEHFEISENSTESPLKYPVDYDKICGDTVLRTRRAGDRFSLPGRGWTKTLKKLFQEFKIPPGKRDRLLVAADALGVVWVEGFGANARVSANSHTARLLVIKTSEEA